MTQHGSASSPDRGRGVPSGSRSDSRDGWTAPHPNEVTDIIPFNEFGDLADLDFSDNAAFDSEVPVLGAPELDDLDDTDNLIPLRLVLPRRSPDPYSHHRHTAGPSGMPARRGKHRNQPDSAVKGRVLIAAMAAGAAAAAAHVATDPSDTAPAPTVLAAGDSALGGGAGVAVNRGMQVVTVKPTANLVVHNEELAKGVAFAHERAEREARLQRPLFAMPTRGMFTSNFGYRWGVLHGGIDIANSIGTPIVAASDGVVIEAGPSAGYGMLVKVRHSDGTVTMYGHVNTTTVNVGERVMAGDQIATMGNRGYSTGSHLHFEVLLGGTNRIDPTSWLANRGINPGA